VVVEVVEVVEVGSAGDQWTGGRPGGEGEGGTEAGAANMRLACGGQDKARYLRGGMLAVLAVLRILKL
jgi:hypothetical protein